MIYIYVRIMIQAGQLNIYWLYDDIIDLLHEEFCGENFHKLFVALFKRK